MTLAEIKRSLRSDDWSRLINGLSALGGLHGSRPSSEVLDLAASLLHHPDPAIRYEAALATGLHWRYGPALERLITIVPDNSIDRELRGIAIRSIASAALHDSWCTNFVLRSLAGVILDRAAPTGLRGLAYLEGRAVSKLPLSQAHRRLPYIDIAKLEVDQELVNGWLEL